MFPPNGPRDSFWENWRRCKPLLLSQSGSCFFPHLCFVFTLFMCFFVARFSVSSWFQPPSVINLSVFLHVICTSTSRLHLFFISGIIALTLSRSLFLYGHVARSWYVSRIRTSSDNAAVRSPSLFVSPNSLLCEEIRQQPLVCAAPLPPPFTLRLLSTESCPVSPSVRLF